MRNKTPNRIGRRAMTYLPNLDAATIAITGGSSGIGLETARAAREAGAGRVVLLARSAERLTEAAAALGLGPLMGAQQMA
ncbi:MAG: SDR family NAD(P)-dependent oxidoreductase, partial [Hyphomicrobiales bacterium]